MIGRVGRLGRSGQTLGPGEPAVLRFAAGLPGRVAYARTGSAVAFDEGGRPRVFAAGAATVTDRGLLIEAAAANAVAWSRPAGTGWSVVSATLGEGGAWGDLTGRTIAATGATWNRAELSAAPIAVVSGQPLLISCCYRAGSSGRARVVLRDAVAVTESTVTGAAGSLAVANQASGAVSSVANVALGEGVFRVSFVFTPNTSNPRTVGVGPDSAVAGQAVEAFHIQAEAGTTPTSPILTVGATATRGAPTITTTVPAGKTAWRSIHFDGVEGAGGGLTPGAMFDIAAALTVVGRTGPGRELRRLEFLA
ncbi:phage head spike fiber domain-containing protein [Brevundimonas sp. VNH65]|uniref:phage head spike fiber domain-containing protein n=1 Tax=Brevundimonas sp. VNH65 TaxID=3400917 RepID=UPI003C0C0D96